MVVQNASLSTSLVDVVNAVIDVTVSAIVLRDMGVTSIQCGRSLTVAVATFNFTGVDMSGKNNESICFSVAVLINMLHIFLMV